MAPVCSECRADAVVFDVPDPIREHAPDGTERASVCRVCLTVDPVDAESVEESLAAVSDTLPEDADIAAGVVILAGLLESIALNRRHIQAVVDYLEAEGVDALLSLDRLAGDTGLRPAVDLRGRTYQLQQLLD